MAANLNVRFIGGILDILLVLLGALLAIAGGFLTQRHQLKLDRAIREERLLIEIEERVYSRFSSKYIIIHNMYYRVYSYIADKS